MEALARALQSTSHKHPWRQCEFKGYFIRQAEALSALGVHVIPTSAPKTLHDLNDVIAEFGFDRAELEAELETDPLGGCPPPPRNGATT